MIKPGKTWQRIKRTDFLCLLEWLCRLQASEITDLEHILTNSSPSPSVLGFLNGLNNPWQAARLSYYKWWSMCSQSMTELIPSEMWTVARDVQNSLLANICMTFKKSKDFWFQEVGLLMKKKNQWRQTFFKIYYIVLKRQTFWKLSQKLLLGFPPPPPIYFLKIKAVARSRNNWKSV